MEMITINPVKDVKMVSKKPPIPPKPATSSSTIIKHKSELPVKVAKGNQMQWKTEDEHVQQIQKLVAMNDKLNVEIGDLRKHLHLEKIAVRELR